MPGLPGLPTVDCENTLKLLLKQHNAFGAALQKLTLTNLLQYAEYGKNMQNMQINMQTMQINMQINMQNNVQNMKNNMCENA